jgi:hypothetical protein
LAGFRHPNRGEGRGNRFVEWRPDAARPSGAAGLIEVELRDGLGLGRVQGRRLVEVVGGERVHRSGVIGVELECGLGRSAGRGESGRGVREVEAAEDGADGLGVGEEGEDAHVRSAVGAAEGEDLVDAGEESGPAGAGGGAGERPSGTVVAVRCRLGAGSFGRTSFGLGGVGLVVAEGDDSGSKSCIGGEDAVIAVAVDPGRRDQAGEGIEELERREDEEGAAVGGGASGLVEDPANAHGVGRPRRGAGLERFGVAGSGWPAACSRFGLDTETVEGEGRAGAVADEPLAAGAVGAVDADGGVEAEAAGPLPGEHVVDGVLIEEAAALEEAEHPALEDGREGASVVSGEVGSLVEAGLAVDLGEDAVEDHKVEVEVGVEGGAEAVEEGDGADPGVGTGAGAGVPQRGADGAEQDPEHGAGEGGVVREVERRIEAGDERARLVLDAMIYQVRKEAGAMAAALAEGARRVLTGREPVRSYG